MILKLVAGSEIDAKIESIEYPILGGGASTCSFSAYTILAINTAIQVLEDFTLRFEGYIIKKSKTSSVGKDKKISYEAVCKSYFDKSQVDENITDYEGSEEDFSGNGVEFELWKVKEKPNLHVTWPPIGNDPVVFDDQEAAVLLPSDIVEQTEIEENSIPSHAKVIVKKWRETRWPCTHAFDISTIPTIPQLQDVKYANYGKLFKIMTPGSGAIPYRLKPLFNANVGGSKFGYIGGAGLEYPKTESDSVGATINSKNTQKTLPKKGSGSGSGSGSGVGSGSGSGYDNYCRIEWKDYENARLPRVTGVHGVDQESYVRARVLESDERIAVGLGGINNEDKIAELEHVEVDVKWDIFQEVSPGVNEYRDLTFGGAKGLLDSEKDLGEGRWSADLSGTYLEKDGIGRANEILNNALLHYQAIKFSADVTFAGIKWDFNKKVTVSGTDICLESISWRFGILASENRTTYRGVRTIDGGKSAQLAIKKKWIKDQEDKNTINKMRNQQVLPQPAVHPGHKTKQHARIAWNIASDGTDKSEGEFVYKEAGAWIGTGKLIWVEYDESKGIAFETAGTETIFQVEKVKTNLDRGSPGTPDVRDSYRALMCVQDSGYRITHFKTLTKTPKITGRLLAAEKVPTTSVWLDVETNGDNSVAYIKTQLFLQVKFNIIAGNLSSEWNLSGAENYTWLRKSGHKHGLNMLVAPINPKFTGINFVWESSEKNIAGSATIATYKKK